MSIKNDGAIPFAGNASYLQAEVDHLAIKCRRLAAMQGWRAAQELEGLGGTRTLGRRRQPAADESARRVALYTAKEELSRGSLDARLKVHRAAVKAGDAAPLALDLLCQEADLAPTERQVLIACLVPAICEELAEQTFGDLDVGFSRTLTAEGVARILEATGIEERLELWRLLSPEGALVRGELLVVDHGASATCPEDFWSAGVALTHRGFEAVLGLASMKVDG